MDGITAEHLLYGIDSNIHHQIANMLSLCIKYSVVPNIITNGMLVPIPKKPGCDISNPRNWCPIVISTTLSKILELYKYLKKVLVIFQRFPVCICSRSRYRDSHCPGERCKTIL